MNSKQRVVTTINFRKPDIVPLALYESLIGAKMVGKSFDKIFLNGKLLAKSKLVVFEEFGNDVIDIEAGVATEAEACGCLVEYPRDNLPWIRKPILEDLKKISKLKVPNPFKEKPMYEVLKAVNIISGSVGEEAFIIGEADQGPFSLASELRGMERFYMDLNFKGNHKYIHELLKFCSEVFITYARALIESGAHIVCMGESPAGPNLISPDMYNVFAQPYEKMVIEDLRKENILVANHICGWVDPILDNIIETGACIIEIDEKTDLKLAKKKSDHKCSIMGAVPPNIITFGNKKDIEKLVKKNLGECMSEYGFILSPGCVLGANTPLENVKYFIDCGRKYGKY